MRCCVRTLKDDKARLLCELHVGSVSRFGDASLRTDGSLSQPPSATSTAGSASNTGNSCRRPAGGRRTPLQIGGFGVKETWPELSHLRHQAVTFSICSCVSIVQPLFEVKECAR